MAEFIDITRMIPEVEGEEKWEYKYLEPQPGENDAMKDTATRDKLQAERNKIVDEYEKTTIHWVQSTGEEAEAAKAKRTKLAGDLKISYWQLDPYIRAKSLYDRVGNINPGGVIKFYPGGEPAAVEKTEVAANDTAAVAAKTDDVKTNGTAAVAEKTEVAANGTAAVAEKTEVANGTLVADAPNGAPVETTV